MIRGVVILRFEEAWDNPLDASKKQNGRRSRHAISIRYFSQFEFFFESEALNAVITFLSPRRFQITPPDMLERPLSGVMAEIVFGPSLTFSEYAVGAIA